MFVPNVTLFAIINTFPSIVVLMFTVFAIINTFPAVGVSKVTVSPPKNWSFLFIVEVETGFVFLSSSVTTASEFESGFALITAISFSSAYANDAKQQINNAKTKISFTFEFLSNFILNLLS